MSDKVKGWLSIILMSFFFFMMCESKYSDALGDYLLNFIGIAAWTRGNSGTHMTVLYFGVLFLASLSIVRRYAVEGLKKRWLFVFLAFIACFQGFTFITDKTIVTIKSHAPGLFAIGYIGEESHMSYSYKNKTLTEFSAELQLTNYSNEEKSFNLAIVPFHARQQGTEINFYTTDGEKAVFHLWPKQTQTFILSLEAYNVDWNAFDGESGSGSGIIGEVILSDGNGDKIKLDSSNFLGIEIEK